MNQSGGEGFNFVPTSPKSQLNHGNVFMAVQAPSGSFPMVEVAGHTGPILVHRYWTDKDMIEAASSLPDPQQIGGRKSGEELEKVLSPND